MMRFIQLTVILFCLIEVCITPHGPSIVAIDSAILFMALVWTPFFRPEQKPGGRNNDQGV